jgi:hypothetical protein
LIPEKELGLIPSKNGLKLNDIKEDQKWVIALQI